ncbi:MAG: methyl-accepting chemotaxis protein [Vibrio sp.]
MKFSHKIVAASSLLLLIVLSFQQQITVRSQVESFVNTSLIELVEGVKNTIEADLNSKKTLAQSTTEVVALDPDNREFVRQVLETPKLKQSYITVGVGYDSDGAVVENDDAWEVEADYEPRTRPWYIDAKQQQKMVVTEPYVDATTRQTVISIGAPLIDQRQFKGAIFFDVELTELADEVRTLAQRTQQSTTEIRHMIEQLQSGANAVSVAMNESKYTADDAVQKAQYANQSLQNIRSAIQRISDMNMQIASAAEEQSLVAEEINSNTVKIKDLSTLVADSAKSASLAMEVQTENVREQDRLLNKFIV